MVIKFSDGSAEVDGCVGALCVGAASQRLVVCSMGSKLFIAFDHMLS